ncbi:MAG: hypothetical protein FWH33_08270 [Oscillospiraceae bacterium]|nr:hypothetical protein [Oscillospiraceae bacterium]
MPKNENIEFLERIYPLTVEDRSYEGLLTRLFRGEARSIVVCSNTAYRDIQRNLAGIGEMPEKEKQAYLESISTLITGCVDDLFKCKLTEQEALLAFDAWHKEICEKICEESNKHNIPKWVTWMESGFTYGLAQKWLNMTIKNMLVMERWDGSFEPIRKYLHIPVDRYIMEAASLDFGIQIPRKHGSVGKYSNTGSKPWSRWEYCDYINFQEAVRGVVCCPIDWEYEAWSRIRNK